jgi:hypothetical protein
MFETHEVRKATFTEDSKELGYLMDTNNTAVLRAIAENPKAYKKHLKVLAQHDDSEARASVASNESTNPTVLAELAKDADKDVRFYVALNTRTPQRALDILLADVDGEVARMARINVEAREDDGNRHNYGSSARFVSNAVAVSLGLISLMDEAGAQG